MCLLTKQSRRKIATEDIHLYKAVLMHNSHPNNWRGVYHFNQEYPFDEVIELKGYNEKNMIDFHSQINILRIGKGFLHSTSNKATAKNIARSSNPIELPINTSFMHIELMKFNAVVCECTIPKGSVYYVDSYDKCNYASNKLIVHKPKNL